MKIIRVELHNDTSPPYNYYQIYKVYADGSAWRLAMLDAELYGILDGIAEQIARHYGVPLVDKRDIPGGAIK